MPHVAPANMDELHTSMNSTGQILYGVKWLDQYYSSKCVACQMLYSDPHSVQTDPHTVLLLESYVRMTVAIEKAE